MQSIADEVIEELEIKNYDLKFRLLNQLKELGIEPSYNKYASVDIVEKIKIIGNITFKHNNTIDVGGKLTICFGGKYFIKPFLMFAITSVYKITPSNIYTDNGSQIYFKYGEQIKLTFKERVRLNYYMKKQYKDYKRQRKIIYNVRQNKLRNTI